MPTKNQRSNDPGRDIMEKFVEFLQRKLDAALLEPTDPGYVALTAAEMQVIQKLMENNSVTLASVRRGEFGAHAQQLAEEFPFPGNDDAQVA